MLTTSREPLGVAGESLVTLTPLGLPAEGSSPSEALRWPSVVLFADRAAAVSPTFVVDEASVSDVVEVVRRLDGLPLALELAAARLRTLALADVRRRLDDRFRLLTGGSRTALPRHRTLRAVVAWSWDLLTADEPALAERACVFPGGLTADSAAAVLPRDDVDELLAALTDKSLLQLVDGGRYRMLETLREYGSELLAERGELLAVRRDHARWFTGLARTADPYLRTSQQLVWLKRLDDEHENLLSALRFLVEEGDSDAALELALDLGWFWVLHGRHAEAAASMDLVMTMPPGSDARLRLGARAVQALNAMAARQEDPFTGGTLEEELAAVADALADVGELHHPVLDVLVPSVMYLADRSEDGARLIERAITSEDTWLRGAAHMFRARFAENDGDLDQVRQDVGPATRAFRDVGDRWGLASVLPLVALLQQYDGDLDAAVTTLEEAEELAAAFGGDVDDRLFIALRLSDLHDRRGDRARSELAMASAREVKGRGSRELRAACDALLAITLLGTGDLDRARDALRDATEALGPPPEAERFAPHGAAVVSAATALLCAVDGDLDGARRRLTDAHRAAVLTRDGPIGAVVAVTGAQVAVLADRLHHAAHLLGAAAVLRGADDSTAVDIRSVQVAVTAGVGEEVFAGAYAAGRGLDRLQATAMLAPDYVCRL